MGEYARCYVTQKDIVKPLTRKQHEMLVFIRDFIEMNGRSPFVTESCNRFGYSSTKSVSDYYRVLERKGYIFWKKGEHGSIRVLIDPDSL